MLSEVSFERDIGLFTLAGFSGLCQVLFAIPGPSPSSSICRLGHQEGIIPLHSFLDFLFLDITSIDPPILRVFNKITGGQSHLGVDCREHANHPTPASDLPAGPLRHSGRVYLLGVDLREAEELNPGLEPVLKTAHHLWKPLLTVPEEQIGGAAGAFSIRPKLDLFYLLMRNLHQYVPPEVDLTPLEARANKFFLNRSLDARLGIGEAHTDLLKTATLQSAVKLPPGAFDSSNIGSMAKISLFSALFTPEAIISARVTTLSSTRTLS